MLICAIGSFDILDHSEDLLEAVKIIISDLN